MSCCGLCNANGDHEGDVSTRPQSASAGRHYQAQNKLGGCLRKHFTQATQRLSSVFSMSRLSSKKAVFFAAVYSESRFPVDGEAASEPVPFDKILSEFPKEVYDPTRGVFTCPKSGAYMFNFSMRPDAPPVTSFNVQLMKEDEPQVSLYANPDGSAGTSSQSCIIEVKQGEKVWIRMLHGAFRSDIRCPSATFNGTLLRQLKM